MKKSDTQKLDEARLVMQTAEDRLSRMMKENKDPYGDDFQSVARTYIKAQNEYIRLYDIVHKTASND